MSLQFNKINININGKYILCETASVSQQGEQKPLYAINYAAPVDYTPDSIKNSLTINYFVETSNEPIYSIISGLKFSNTTGNTQAIIMLGNVTFTGYLNKFSYSVSPMNTIKAQAAFDIFTPIIGNFSQGNSTDGNLYNLSNSSGLINYFSAYLYSGSSKILNSNILQFDYDFDCTAVPIYSIGNIYPVQVYISEAKESINTISEIQNNNQFSGQNLYNLLGVDSIVLTNISNTWGYSLNQLIYNISGMKNNSSRIDISNRSLILFNNTFSQSF